MKTYTEFNEGLLSRKSPEEKKLESMRDDLSKLAQKSSGKGGWSEGEQKKYNQLWIAYRKLNDGKPPKGPKPSLYWDRASGMSLYKHAELNKKFQAKLGIKEDKNLVKTNVDKALTHD